MNPDILCMGCLEDRGSAEVCPRCGWREGTPPDSHLTLPPRYILEGKYLIGRVLGQGGFGITYLGLDLNLGRKLAIKEYFPNSVATRAMDGSTVVPMGSRAKEDFEYGRSRFLEEGRMLARFQDHPGVASVFDVTQRNETAYLLMNYVAGVTLKQYLQRNGNRIPFELAVKILIPVMDALREVHATGMLHRDVSPDNIFLTYTGQVKILDFGAARYSMGEHSRNLSVILKPGYAPEEQYRTKGEQGPWTDIYALSATLYHCVTGVLPPDAIDRLAQDELQWPRSLGVTIPESSEAALMQGLAVKARDRFQTVQAFQRAVTPIAVPQPPPPQPPRPGPQPQPQPGPTPLPPLPPRPQPAPLPRKGIGAWKTAFFGFLATLLAWGGFEGVQIWRHKDDLPVIDNGDTPKPIPQPEPQPQPTREERAPIIPPSLPTPRVTLPTEPVTKNFLGFRNEDSAGNHIKPVDQSETDEQSNSVYHRVRLNYLGYRLVLDNKYYGISDQTANLKVIYYGPDGVMERNPKISPPDGTMSNQVRLPKTQATYTEHGRWGVQGGNYYKEGLWRVEFYWNNELVAKGTFRVIPGS